MFIPIRDSPFLSLQMEVALITTKPTRTGWSGGILATWDVRVVRVKSAVTTSVAPHLETDLTVHTLYRLKSQILVVKNGSAITVRTFYLFQMKTSLRLHGNSLLIDECGQEKAVHHTLCKGVHNSELSYTAMTSLLLCDVFGSHISQTMGNCDPKHGPPICKLSEWISSLVGENKRLIGTQRFQWTLGVKIPPCHLVIYIPSLINVCVCVCAYFCLPAVR